MACDKGEIWVYLNLILGKSGVTHDLGWWLVGKPVVDFRFTVIKLFSLSITVPGLWGKICAARLFLRGLNLIALKFYLDMVVPTNHSWHQKTRDWVTRRWRPRPSAFPRFDTIPECDGRTDGRMNGFAVAYTALARLRVCFVERCKNCNEHVYSPKNNTKDRWQIMYSKNIM